MAKKRRKDATESASPEIVPPVLTEPPLEIPESAVEARTQELGRKLWSRWKRSQPSFFERRWWDDRILGVAMADESVKVQMFRFVDVLPRLRTHEDVTRHLQEYFDEVRTHLPWAVELVKYGIEHIRPNSVLSRALALNARRNAVRMARRFIAGESLKEVLDSLQQLRRRGLAFTLDLLGEAVLTEEEAEAYQQHYLRVITELTQRAEQWPENVTTDRNSHGPIPRVNVSLKLSALVSQFRVIDPEGTSAAVKERLRPILRAARDAGAFVNVDMEQYSYKDLTLQIFREVLDEDEFREMADVGVVIQAYLQDTDRDLRELRAWVERRGCPISVRFVKGAYWDYETIVSIAYGWPMPVYQQKWQTDDNYERNTRYLLENARWLRPAFGSHNLRSLVHVIACARELNVPPGDYELQMLYGMAEDLAQVLVDMGERVRIYTPFGELIPGMAYLVRRLLENTSNDSFLKHSYAEDIPLETLLMKPADAATLAPPPPAAPELPFVNEPHSDFSRDEVRSAMQAALDAVSDELGREYGLVINGKQILNRPSFASINPSHKTQVVGRIARATPDDVDAAIDAARRAFVEWSRVDVNYRAEYLELMAREMRQRRFELAAWEVFEVGKTWAEADADVAEAIDFCLYYAQEMRRLDAPRPFDLPGEENRYFYRPRGVAVVIAPWNFPLAILTGMTAAALVSGNTVIMKPAEQSSVIGAKLMEIIHAAGVPDNVVHFLPGIGEELGPPLVGSPDVDVIAFTGSRSVGLSINELAAQSHAAQRSVKHVLAEMGGKNAIIVDSDADLDEAVQGVIQSAFGYSGQKCSACSRVIVVQPAYGEFLDRLVAATKALKVGPAELPGTDVGPVVDDEAYQRLRDFVETLQADEQIVPALTEADWPGVPTDGYYLPPQIFAHVPPDSRLAQEELFGPVLAVMAARDMAEALEIANGTAYALTGGCFSRSPANLKRVRQEFQVGNLYLNRGITGALVARQPFGGFRMSGIGTKAGGPDYLLQFLIPINVTENTMRRGFAPSATGASAQDATPTTGE